LVDVEDNMDWIEQGEVVANTFIVPIAFTKSVGFAFFITLNIARTFNVSTTFALSSGLVVLGVGLADDTAAGTTGVEEFD
jgi:hypothetical protein